MAFPGSIPCPDCVGSLYSSFSPLQFSGFVLPPSIWLFEHHFISMLQCLGWRRNWLFSAVYNKVIPGALCSNTCHTLFLKSYVLTQYFNVTGILFFVYLNWSVYLTAFPLIYRCVPAKMTDLNHVGSHLPALHVSVVNDDGVGAPLKSLFGCGIKLAWEKQQRINNASVVSVKY